jgi:hypothetical protein
MFSYQAGRLDKNKRTIFEPIPKNAFLTSEWLNVYRRECNV